MVARPMTPQDGCAWITGASSGIGRALALRLAVAGWQVAVSARRAEALEELAAEPGAQGRIHAFALDVTDRAATAETLESIESRVAPVALAVLNAGTHQPMTARDFDADVVRRLMELNCLSMAEGLAALLPKMRARGQGQVALVSSVAGYRGLPTAAAYGASKAAVIVMAESLRPELDDEGILLQVVNPGFVRTPLTEKNPFTMPMLMEVEDAAAALHRGLGRSRFEIVFPRVFCWLVKLYRAMPYALALRLAKRMVPET